MLIDDHCWGPWISVLLVLSHFSSRPCTINQNFPLLCAWGLTSGEFSSSGGGTAVVPGWDPCLDRWWEEVKTALRCHWMELLKWGKWCTLEAPPGYFVICIASLLPPAQSSWGPFPCMLGTGGRLAKHFCWFCGVKPMHCKGVRCRRCLERRRQLCDPCALCLTCKDLRVLGDRSVSFSARPLRPEAQMGSVLADHVPCPAAAHTPPSPLWAQFEWCSSCWGPHLCTPCCCYLCCSQLSSCCQWQFSDWPVSPEKYAPEHIPYNIASGDTAQQSS